MFNFLLKKYFYTFLDHIYKFLLLNFMFLLTLLGSAGLLYLFSRYIPDPHPNLIYPAFGLSLLGGNLFSGAAAGVMNEMIDYKKVQLRHFWRYLRSSALNSILFTLLNTAILFLFTNALNFYVSTRLILAPFAITFIIWLGVLWMMASQFFYAIHYRLEKNFFKILKKMVLLLLDNLLFSLFCLIAATLILVIDIPTLFMLPGLVSAQLFMLIAVRLRLYKYSYLEEHRQKAGENQTNLPKKMVIPWEELLREDASKLGRRSLLTTFFPSKK